VRAIGHDAGLCGLYHCTAAGETSWHGYARFVIELGPRADGVRPVPTSAYATPARRPLNSRLACDKLRQGL
jgi:dTDP-4-dehydrorhamnose reductase